MRLLLDTRVAIQATANHPNLSDKARRLIGAADAIIFVSAATIREISIKNAAPGHGGLTGMPTSGVNALSYFKAAGFQMLDISTAHTVAVESLPPLHAAPFDRMLVAQALTVPLRLLTANRRVAAYSDVVILV